MGLCLHVFGPADGDDDPEEIAECDVGHHSDFVASGTRLPAISMPAATPF